MPIPSFADIHTRSHVNPNGAQVTTTHGANGTYSVTTVDAAGNIESGDFNANRVLTFFAWRNADDGSRGSANFNSQGGFVSAYIWEADGKLIQIAANGSYDETVESGGNSMTRYYTSAGKLTGESWDNADGSKGRKEFNADGSLKAAYEWGADGTLKQTAADGSYDLTQTRSDGRTDTYYFDASGASTGQASWTNPDGTYGRSFDNGDGTRTYYEFEGNGRYTRLVADWYGNNDVEYYTADNQLYKTGYTRADGHRGGTHYNPDGSYTRYDTNPDGSYLQTDRDANGSVTQQWYTADNQPIERDQPPAAGNTAAQADALVAAMAGFSAGDGAAGASAAAQGADAELLLAGSAA